MIQRRVYFWNPLTNDVMALPVQPLAFYRVALSAGWQRCTRKMYKQGLLKRRVTRS